MFDVSIPLLVESTGLICVLVNPMIPYSVFYVHLLYHLHLLKVISHYEQEGGHHLKWYFVLLWKINHFSSGVNIQILHL